MKGQAVTDPTPWQSPGGAQEPAPIAPPVAPIVPAPQIPGFGQPSTGWAPPPKPGLIPLRPLTLGATLGASFQVLRRNPRPTFGVALLLTGGVFVFALLVVGAVSVFAFSRAASATEADQAQIDAGSIALIAVSSLIPVVLSIIVSAVLQGIISLEVARGTVGEKLTFGGLWRSARGRMGALIGWSFLITLVVGVAVVVIVLIVVALTVGTGSSPGGVIAAVLLAILFSGALVVVGFWVGTRVSLVPSILMIERLPLRQAIARSWSLTTGYFWRTLGIQLLVSIILSVASQIVTTPISVVFGLLTTLINPNGDEAGFVAGAIASYGLLILVTLVIGAISTIVQSATSALIYIDLRMRKEGLDLELIRFVEARQSGAVDVADPYLTVPGATPAGTQPGAQPPPPPSTSPWA